MRWEHLFRHVVLILSIFVLANGIAFAASGDPDTSFGDAGFARLNILGDDQGYRVAIQGDGKILVAVAGEEKFDIVRFTATGAVDSTFSGDGIASVFGSSIATFASAVAVQSDGKIVAAGAVLSGGSQKFGIARFLNNGSLDSSFSTDGKTTLLISKTPSAAFALAIQPDGKILVAGSTGTAHGDTMAIARLKADGTLDKSFGSRGKAIVSFGVRNSRATAIGLTSDGRIVIGGWAVQNDGINPPVWSWAAARLLSNGTLDTSFSSDGKVTLFSSTNSADTADELAIQSDDKVILVGAIAGTFGLVRLNTNGTLDQTFSNDGIQKTPFGDGSHARGVRIRSDRRIMVAGDYFSSSGAHIAVARYLPGGSLDTSFSTDGVMTSSYPGAAGELVNDLALQSDGKFVLTGILWNDSSDQDIMVARFWQ